MKDPLGHGRRSGDRPIRPRLFGQVGLSMGTNVIIGVSRFAALPILAYAITPAEFGVYSLINAVVGFELVFLGLGLHMYTYRAVPGMPDREAGRLLGASVLVELAIAGGLLVLVAASGAGDAFLRVLNVEPYGDAFLLGAIWLVLELFDVNMRIFLLARERIGHANVVDLLRQILWIPVSLAFWLASGHLNVHIVVASSALGSAAAATYGIVAAGRSLLYGVQLSRLGTALRFSMPLLVSTAGMPVMRLAERSVMSAARSLEEVAAYSILTALASGLYSVSSLAIETTLLPRALRAANLGNLRRSRSILWTSMTYSGWAFALGAAAIWLAAVALVRLNTLHSGYAEAFAYLPIVFTGYLLAIFSRAAHNTLIVAGRTAVIFSIDFTTLVLFVAMDLLLIPPFGIPGAAAAPIASFGAAGGLKFFISGLWRHVSWRQLLVPWSRFPREEQDARGQ